MLLLNKNQDKKTFENTSEIQNMENCKGCKDLFSTWYILFWVIMAETECCNKEVKES